MKKSAEGVILPRFAKRDGVAGYLAILFWRI